MAYADVAQAGATCQHVTNTDSSKRVEGFNQEFKCNYGTVPFSQTYVYEQDMDDNGEPENGMYHKYVTGAKMLLNLPTVLYDVQKDENGYDLLAEFSCLKKVGITTTELRYSSRNKTVS